MVNVRVFSLMSGKLAVSFEWKWCLKVIRGVKAKVLSEKLHIYPVHVYSTWNARKMARVAHQPIVCTLIKQLKQE